MNIVKGTYNITYRYLNNEDTLEEIDFYINYPREKPIDIIEDMVHNNLLLGRNAEILSFNIHRLLKSDNNEPIYFPLYDEKKKLNGHGYEKQIILKRGYGCLYMSNIRSKI
tara:strand:+ start:1151 stop:1483 length:333 start_codon:yes stop_codon:yes gene_type:complete